MSDAQIHDPRSSHALLSKLDGIANCSQDAALLAGRVLLGWIFMQGGWAKLMNVQSFAAGLPRRGLPEFMGYIGAPVEFFGGVAILLGLGTRYAAIAILLFTIVATFSSHAYWTFPPEQQSQQATQFFKNLSIMGGLMLLFATGAGRASIDRLLRGKERA